MDSLFDLKGLLGPQGQGASRPQVNTTAVIKPPPVPDAAGSPFRFSGHAWHPGLSGFLGK